MNAIVENYQTERGSMNKENKEIADILREEAKRLRSDRLIKLESERKLEQRLQVGRQRIREVINQLVSEGLLVKYEGKGTYVAPIVRNKYINLICSPTIKRNDPFYNRMLMELTTYAAKNSVNMIPLAMVNRPKILIADEPTTALDVTVQAQITDLMKRFQKEYNMSIIYITHDMGVIAEMADTIAVMYLGRVVESGSVRGIFQNPLHPYTRGLLRSMPVLGNKTGEKLNAIEGNVPVPLDPPAECGFCSRCPNRTPECSAGIPALKEVEPGHLVRCFHV